MIPDGLKGGSLKDWLDYATEQLGLAGVPDADVDARILLEYAANIDRSYYYLHMREPLDDADAELYAFLIERRAAREPVQYITGEAPFYGEIFYVTPDVLIPRQDTEILVEEAEKRAEPGMLILDLCTGSGCVLLSLVKRNSVFGIGSDKSPAALAVAEQNRRRMRLRTSWIESDLFERIGGTFDMIVSNPPYIPAGDIGGLDCEVRDHEPLMALDGGRDGLDIIRRIITDAGGFLREGGWLLIEIGFDQGKAVSELLKEEGYEEIETVRDLEGRDRVAIGRKAWRSNNS